MKRRKFIQTTALGLAAAAAPLPFWGQKPEETILGQGSKRYKVNTQWSQANAENHPVNDCHEMVEDQKGRLLLLTNETKNNVLIYDKSGKLLEAWGTEYPGAHGFTLFNENGQDRLFITDTVRHQVIKTTIDGRVLMTLDYPRESGQYQAGVEYLPTETAIAPNGDIYIADGYGRDFIVQYNSHGQFIRYFGGRGTAPSSLLNAHGICIDARNPAQPCLVVSSRQHNAFKRFTLEGVYLDTIPMPGAWVCRPVIKGDYLYVAVLQTQRRQGEKSGFIAILDRNYRVISNLGGSEPQYTDGKLAEMYQTVRVFQYPHDVCVDGDENLYIPQWNSGKVYPYQLKPV